MNHPSVKLIECPRDAMQGWKTFIPTERKIEYINSLLKVGFDTIDFGSFVSPKAIPQMADTSEVVGSLEPVAGSTKLLAIVANLRGAKDASNYERIDYIGFPFSVSETFQKLNTNSTIRQSFGTVEDLVELCEKSQKKVVVYLSMGFGNPYGEEYNEEIVMEWTDHLIAAGVDIISLADTVGLATPQMVYDTASYLIESYPNMDIGVHLHSTPENWKEKLEAAVKAGCKRFDGALKGIGGCPMADDELVGNMNMEMMIGYFEEKGIGTGIRKEALAESLRIASEIFI